MRFIGLVYDYDRWAGSKDALAAVFFDDETNYYLVNVLRPGAYPYGFVCSSADLEVRLKRFRFEPATP